MSNFGLAKTSKFIIGAYELRIGPLSKAGQLTAAHTIGMSEDVSFKVDVSSVKLKGGLPQVIVDSMITEQPSTLEAKLRESSNRNLEVLLGNPVEDYAAAGGDAVGVVDTAAAIAANAVSITCTTVTGTFAANDLVVVYDKLNPGNVSVCRLDAYDTGTKTLTFNAKTPVNSAFAAGGAVAVYKADPIAIGGLTSTNYFSVQMVRIDRQTSRPTVFDFWKAAITAGVSIEGSLTDYGTLPFSVDLLQPVENDYGVGGPLEHAAAEIAKSPVGRIAGPRDIL